jgi:hypothetical protein
VTFRVDADGLLSVTAKELTTGVEQKVEVKPSYGLTDEEVENMLLAALDHGEEDFEKRRLIEARVEADRVVMATRKALAADADLLEPGEREKVDAALAAWRRRSGARAPGRSWSGPSRSTRRRTRGRGGGWIGRWRRPSRASRCRTWRPRWPRRPGSRRT